MSKEDTSAQRDRDEAPYSVSMSPLAEAAASFVTTKKDIARVKKMLLLLDTVPYIGQVYDPDYPASRPPFQMRMVFAGRYGIYYVVDEAEKRVDVLFIEDQRRDPLNRFFELYPHEEL